MAEKTNTGLVAYARAQLGRPYWFGTFGQKATQALYTYNKSRLPGYYTAADFPKQYGQRVHDCAGLIKGYLWSDGPEAAPNYCSGGVPDISADQMKASCTELGGMSNLPEIPGASSSRRSTSACISATARLSRPADMPTASYRPR